MFNSQADNVAQLKKDPDYETILTDTCPEFLKTHPLNHQNMIVKSQAGSKPSTWLPPGGLVEHIKKKQKVRAMISCFNSLSLKDPDSARICSTSHLK